MEKQNDRKSEVLRNEMRDGMRDMRDTNKMNANLFG